MNTKGDRFGNCGSESKGIFKVFSKCKARDVKSGRLLWENIQRLPCIEKHQTPSSPCRTHGIGVQRFFEATDWADEEEVKDDTTYGSRKICINQSCIDTTVLHYDRKLDKSWSHGRGICRNFKNCHCIYVYAPPTCEFKGYIVWIVALLLSAWRRVDNPNLAYHFIIFHSYYLFICLHL